MPEVFLKINFENNYLLTVFFLASFSIGNNSMVQTKPIKQNSTFMIRHTVVFKLKSSKDSTEVVNFFNAAKKLSNIPGVQDFECLRQISKKNDFEYGLSMEFVSLDIYEKYTSHPDHINFVKQFWLKEVEDFLEIDYERL